MHGKIFITLKEHDGMIQVSVKDTGVGISEEGKSKIFEKFYRDPEAQKKEIIGSGIGLYTTKKIVETNGGKIWFESSKGEGTTFFFTIPVFKQMLHILGGVVYFIQFMAKTILIIEDDNFLQGLEAKKLQKEGYDVLVSDETNFDVAWFLYSSEYKWVKNDLLNDDLKDFESFRVIKWKYIS